MSALVLTHARVVTGVPTLPLAKSLRIEGTRITHVGDDLASLPGTRLSLRGATVLPGLIDAHFHLHSLGEEREQLDLAGLASPSAVVERIVQAAAHTPPGTWLKGRGWDDGMWSASPADFARLSEHVHAHPAWLIRKDGHAAWVNERALDDVMLPEQIPGGEIVRDATGKRTGVLVDNAMELVRNVVPIPTSADIERQVRAAIARCREVGLVHVHDMGMTPEVLAVLEELEARGELELRVTCYLYGTATQLASYLARPPKRSGLVRVVGIKLFVDGALGSRGAALFEPYCDCPLNRGLMLASTDELLARARDAHTRGYQVAVHAIGDHANAVALDVLSRAQGDDPTRRHRIEHAQIVRPADRDRFARHGIIASMQPTHATGDMPWAAERLGAERLRWSYAWKELLAAGATLALGSDAPVENENPWWGVHAAVTRQKRDGTTFPGFSEASCLNLAEALHGFTRAAAYASHDTDLGIIAPGAVADLTILDANPESLATSALHSVGTLGTVLDGRPSESLLRATF